VPQQFVQNPLNQFEPERLPVGWPWRLFIAAFGVFLATVLGYVGILFGYQPYLRNQIQQKTNEIEQLSETIPKADQDQFINFYSQLVNLKNILDSHVMASPLFSFLERTTHPRVYFANASMKFREGELELNGLAESYAAVTEQLEVFSQAPEIDRLLVSQAQLGERNLVGFKVAIRFKKGALK
jgi:Tfp pilus assembly protein PilN